MNILRSIASRMITPAVVTVCLAGATSALHAAEREYRHHRNHANVQVVQNRVRAEHARQSSHRLYPQHSVTAGVSIPIQPIPFGRIVVSLPGAYRTYRCGDRSYYHCNGVFYSRHFHGYEVVSAPRIRFLPDHTRRLAVGGKVYFVHNDQYYWYRDGFYELCVPPVADNADITNPGTVVMVENSNGSRTPVELRALGSNQWKGPRGEIYNGFPDNGQLREGYGF